MGRADDWVARKQAAPGACGCFAAGTLVWTLVGLAPIESIRVGDIVLAHDVTTNTSRYRVVTREIKVREAALIELTLLTESNASTNADTNTEPGMIGGDGMERIQVTDEHPFYVEGRGWTRADSLRPGDAVRTLSGSTRIAVVESLRFTSRRTPVYNLTVDGDHTYHVGVGGVVVHNAECDYEAIVKHAFERHGKKFGASSEKEYAQLIERVVRNGATLRRNADNSIAWLENRRVVIYNANNGKGTAFWIDKDDPIEYMRNDGWTFDTSIGDGGK